MKTNPHISLFSRLVSRVVVLLLVLLSRLPAGAEVPLPPGCLAEMDRLLAAAFPASVPGAAVLVVYQGAPVLRKGYGLANLELGVPVDPAHVFPVCSITKQFTAVAVLQLAAAGKVKLDDDIRTFVPDYPTGDTRVTLAQLLGHTSGLPSIEEQPAWRKSWREELTPGQLLDFTRGQAPSFAPGSNWKYSNTGYILLGRVIEKASGQSYPEYVRTQLFAPAAMTHSFYPDADRIIPGRVRGYTRAGKAWANAPFFVQTQADAAGALLANVDDLWAWDRALQSGALGDPACFVPACTAGRLPDGRSTRYGYGWEVSQLAGQPALAHGGGMPGFAAFVVRVPASGVFIALLANTDSPAVPLRNLAASLVRLTLGEAALASAPVATADLAAYAGNYRIGGGATFTVRVKDNRLVGQLGPGQRPLTPVATDEFKTPGDDMRLSFVRDDAHRVRQVVVRPDGPGPELVWSRIDEAPPAL